MGLNAYKAKARKGTDGLLHGRRYILLALLQGFDTSTRDGANLHAAFCQAFAGFLRMGEFTYANEAEIEPNFEGYHITKNSVTFAEDSLTLHIPAFQTDPFRRGVSILIAATGDEACPLCSLCYLYRAFPSAPNAPFFQSSKGSSRPRISAILRSMLEDLGYQSNYSGHSFRGARYLGRAKGPHSRNYDSRPREVG